MALRRTPCAVRFAFWVDVQHDFCYFLPVCSVRVGVEQAQVGAEMFRIVVGEIASPADSSTASRRRREPPYLQKFLNGAALNCV
jgi:hypothetical protein